MGGCLEVGLFSFLNVYICKFLCSGIWEGSCSYIADAGGGELKKKKKKNKKEGEKRKRR